LKSQLNTIILKYRIAAKVIHEIEFKRVKIFFDPDTLNTLFHALGINSGLTFISDLHQKILETLSEKFKNSFFISTSQFYFSIQTNILDSFMSAMLRASCISKRAHIGENFSVLNA
jgi:hypothetical protein